jgi:hypothetical protein
MKRELVLINVTNTESAKAILKAEMAKRDISRQQLADMLFSLHGEQITKASIDNKLSRGTFSADFFLDCIRVIGCNDIAINCPKQFDDEKQ